MNEFKLQSYIMDQPAFRLFNVDPTKAYHVILSENARKLMCTYTGGALIKFYTQC